MNRPGVYMCPLSWTSLPTPSPSHPSRSSQCTSPESSVSCIEPRLAIYFTYGNIHASMLVSQIILPSPSPTESKSLLIYMCLFCCLAYRVIGEGNGNLFQYSCLENPMNGGAWQAAVHGATKSFWDKTERPHFHFSLSCVGEGNENPLKSSCLENPRDDGAWWDAIYGVAQSRTRLKQLSSSI